MPAALSSTLANFIADMNIQWTPYQECVAATTSRGRYSEMPDASPMINPNGYIGRYQLSADTLTSLGLLNSAVQTKEGIQTSSNWVQIADTTGSVQGEVLAPFFSNAPIFSVPDTPQFVSGNSDAFLLDYALQDKCFIASTYMNFLQLKSYGVITGKETTADRAGWLNVTEFVGFGSPGSLLSFAVGMVLSNSVVQQITNVSGAVGLFVYWKILGNNPANFGSPDPTGKTPYDYFLQGSQTQS